MKISQTKTFEQEENYNDKCHSINYLCSQILRISLN